MLTVLVFYKLEIWSLLSKTFSVGEGTFYSGGRLEDGQIWNIWLSKNISIATYTITMVLVPNYRDCNIIQMLVFFLETFLGNKKLFKIKNQASISYH